jgi:hypothetical protein
LTSQPINNGPLAFQLNSSGLSTTGNCQVLWPVNNGYSPLNDVDIDILLRKENTVTAYGLKENSVATHSLCLHHVGPPLFGLVILRVYLGRPPENDGHIYELVKQNQVYRIWSPHERALAACHGESNTSSNSPLSEPPTPLLYNLAVVNDNDLVISDEVPLVAIKSPQPVNWMVSPGLAGGLRKPRRYRPPHLQLIATGTWPKPQPAYETVANVSDQSALAGSRGGECKCEGQTISCETDVTGTLGNGQASVEVGRAGSSLDSSVDNGEKPVRLRQSKRARIALST